MAAWVATPPPASPAPVRLWELAALAVLLGAYLATMALLGARGADVVNIVGPIVMSVILAGGALPLVLRDAASLWTPLFWFRIASLVYFGFGSVEIYFLSPQSKAEIAGFFSDYMDQITKLNAVTTLGVLLVLTAALASFRLMGGAREAPAPSQPGGGLAPPPRTLLFTGAVFAAIGETVKFVFVVPVGFGLTSELLPGAIGSLSLLSGAGVYLLAVWAFAYRPVLVIVPVLLTLVDVSVSLLQFAKSDAIAAVMMLTLAWLSKGVNARRLFVCALVVVATFSLIVPFVEGGRREMIARHQGLGGAGFAERMEISGEYLDPDRQAEVAEDEPGQQGLLRFSYVNCGSLAIFLHDSGQPGRSLATLPAAFVPRLFWPDKPNMTEIGNQFNYLANGNYDSASSPGLFAEAYWNLGWAGLPLLMIPLGVIFQLWGAFSLDVMRQGKWVLFPFCLLGLKIGTRVDGFIVPDVVGTLVLALCAYAAIRLVRDTYPAVARARPPLSAPRLR